MMDSVGAILIGTFILALYFLPSIVAGGRNHASSGGILVINLFLGWTVLGWIGALAWAASRK
jgi:hypothetical protein